MIHQDNVDIYKSTVSIRRHDSNLSKHGNIPVRNIKRDIEKGFYKDIGPISENENIIN